LISRITSSPASRPASRVAWRWASVKFAGTVITASWIWVPSWRSAARFRWSSTCDEISGIVIRRSRITTIGCWFGPSTTE